MRDWRIEEKGISGTGAARSTSSHGVVADVPGNCRIASRDWSVCDALYDFSRYVSGSMRWGAERWPSVAQQSQQTYLSKWKSIFKRPLFSEATHAIYWWKCGDSYFTKYSSCSFDRAAHDPDNLLNPLHSSVRPIGFDEAPSRPSVDSPVPAKRGLRGSTMEGERISENRENRADCSYTRRTSNNEASVFGSTYPIIDTSVLNGIYINPVGCGSEASYARDAKTGEVIPVLLSEVGKASRFGDKQYGEEGKCHVFEVVLQSKEVTVCPACARSPKRSWGPSLAIDEGVRP
ncbi:hypothetical protein CC78DRAFT_573161 [Lojkania enalia]|uniref:Uncharacterized protein n=1 Tax=Lojkania enalia TaxID=147567 RepID=A0A9P4NCW3_9PLEO|nr:hypothetical protein CC78DRAFT_573161 [Didymosphaeria enalia]